MLHGKLLELLRLEWCLGVVQRNNKRNEGVMVDFNKLRASAAKPKITDPIEIFRRLPKSAGINDLYTSQAEVLKGWYDRRHEHDIVLKLHTGGGKTLVGLLMAQSTLNEMNEPVLYLTPTTQLVNQTLEKAKLYGINAVPYQKGIDLNDEFRNGSAVMVATYSALFNGKSKFGLRGTPNPVKVGAVILDDAHTAFDVVRDAFTLTVSASKEAGNEKLFSSLSQAFRKDFNDMGRLGSFDDVISGREFGVLEVPYWAWRARLDQVRDLLTTGYAANELTWPFLRDNLHLCHALVSHHGFTITPALPLVNALPTFFEAPRRIYMSATIADDSELIRTFDVAPTAVEKALTSRALAGISERMILIPELMPFGLDLAAATRRILTGTVNSNRGTVILVPSNKLAAKWTDVAKLPEKSADVETTVHALQEGKTFGPVVFANRYDGIDLPGEACRLLILDGLPTGTSDYELYRASALYGGGTITRLQAQRIEQGLGRGARGGGDYCVVLITGGNLVAWIAKEANFRYLTSATRAQLEMGADVSRSVESERDLWDTICKSFARDTDWVQYHAETLADKVGDVEVDARPFNIAAAERKAVNLWQDGNHESAIAKVERTIEDNQPDNQTAGWLWQLAGRIADTWEHSDKAEAMQRNAFGRNRNLLRPKVLPPYRAVPQPGPQAQAIAQQLEGFRSRRGLLREFDEAVTHLNRDASAKQFEQALTDLGTFIGIIAERHDVHGVGPDVLWLLPSKFGVIIEAKSRKKETGALTKEDHGQLLVAQEWFTQHYHDYQSVKVAVVPQNRATRAASAHASHALTYENLQRLVTDVRTLLTQLCDSSLTGSHLVAECAARLRNSTLEAGQLVANYLVPFGDT